MTDFERIRDSALGYLRPEERVSWVRDISQEGSDYDRAYQKLLDIRERLCLRFGVESEDDDLDALMGAVLELEQAVAQGVFDAAMGYAARDCQL